MLQNRPLSISQKGYFLSKYQRITQIDKRYYTESNYPITNLILKYIPDNKNSNRDKISIALKESLEDSFSPNTFNEIELLLKQFTLSSAEFNKLDTEFKTEWLETWKISRIILCQKGMVASEIDRVYVNVILSRISVRIWTENHYNERMKEQRDSLLDQTTQ